MISDDQSPRCGLASVGSPAFAHDPSASIPSALTFTPYPGGNPACEGGEERRGKPEGLSRKPPARSGVPGRARLLVPFDGSSNGMSRGTGFTGERSGRSGATGQAGGGVILWVSATLMLGAPAAVSGEQERSVTASPRAAEAMTLLESDDPYQRQLGFLRLEALREPSTADALRKYLDSKDPDMRAYSLRALAAIEGVRAVPRLLDALKTDKHPRVRRAALLGLEPLQQRDPEILPTLIRALRDRKPEVRMTAVDIVSRIDHPRAREAIFMRSKGEWDRNVRRVLSSAMKRLGTD